MSKRSHTMAIPPEYLYTYEKPRFILWLASLNLPPDAAYRTYKDWCEHTNSRILRSDLDDLCGTDFNVN